MDKGIKDRQTEGQMGGQGDGQQTQRTDGQADIEDVNTDGQLELV